jgi:hypothetical protein
MPINRVLEQQGSQYQDHGVEYSPFCVEVIPEQAMLPELLVDERLSANIESSRQCTRNPCCTTVNTQGESYFFPGDLLWNDSVHGHTRVYAREAI